MWGHKLDARKEQTTLSTDIGSRTASGSTTLKDETTTATGTTSKDEKRLIKDHQPTKFIKVDKESREESSLSQDLSTSFADDEERHDLGSREPSVSIADSEKSFRRHYQSITHRMIHRRASMELYKRIMNNTFAIEKNVTISRVNNEFGFRIHGSKPVVVSAIEKGKKSLFYIQLKTKLLNF